MIYNSALQASRQLVFQDFFKDEGKTKRILIVDDDIEFRLILSELLVGQGYAISTAKNGKAAIACLKSMEDLPQLILLDRNMPDGNGMEFIKMQKSFKKLADIPVVLVSGDIMDADSYRQIGVKACISKPLDVLEFVDVVQKTMAS